MTELQALMQLRHLLQARTWKDPNDDNLGSGLKVFGDNVVISAGARNDDIVSHLSFPAAVIIPGGSQHDAEGGDDPRVLTTNPRVRLIQAVQGDAVGQGVMIGHGVDDEGHSSGQGLLQIQEQVFLAIEELSRDSGIFIIVTAASEAAVVDMDEYGMLNVRDISFRARVTTRRHYPSVPTITPTSQSGAVKLDWTLPASRYDLLRVKVRRGAGQGTESAALAAAPTAHDGGTGVTLAGNLVSTVTDSVSANWYGYSIFAMYDDRSSTPTNEDHSSERLRTAGQAT